jgi:phage-related protein
MLLRGILISFLRVIGDIISFWGLIGIRNGILESLFSQFNEKFTLTKSVIKGIIRILAISTSPNRTWNNSDRNPIGKSNGVPLENVPKFRVHNLTP